MLSINNTYSCNLSFSQEQENLFMELTGDNNPVHWDNNAALKAGFTQPIVHGMLAASMIGKVLGMDFPGNGTINIERNFTFIQPLYIGESYMLFLKVSEIDKDTHTGKIKFCLKNANEKTCLAGSTLVKNNNQF